MMQNRLLRRDGARRRRRPLLPVRQPRRASARGRPKRLLFVCATIASDARPRARLRRRLGDRQAGGQAAERARGARAGGDGRRDQRRTMFVAGRRDPVYKLPRTTRARCPCEELWRSRIRHTYTPQSVRAARRRTPPLRHSLTPLSRIVQRALRRADVYLSAFSISRSRRCRRRARRARRAGRRRRGRRRRHRRRHRSAASICRRRTRYFRASAASSALEQRVRRSFRAAVRCSPSDLERVGEQRDVVAPLIAALPSPAAGRQAARAARGGAPVRPRDGPGPMAPPSSPRACRCRARAARGTRSNVSTSLAES